jgi:murein DD-endopeptidase MepM/ murein hydrolase activator NlpD
MAAMVAPEPNVTQTHTSLAEHLGVQRRVENSPVAPLTGVLESIKAPQWVAPDEVGDLPVKTQPVASESVNGPRCQPSESPAYCVYTVREGETLGDIAVMFGLSGSLPGWELLAASNKPAIISSDDFIQPGQRLRIPRAKGVVHTVILGESVGELAELFDVTSAAIVTANRLPNSDLVRIGEVILIPDPRRLPSPQVLMAEAAAEPKPETVAPPAREAQPAEATRAEAVPAAAAPAEAPAPAPAAPAAPPPAPPAPPPPPQSSAGFISPLTASRNITSYFGPQHPLGVDFGLSHAPGSAVVAVAAGRVEFAGGNPCCSYGLYVIIDHGNGLKTLYAHFSRINVSPGQWVEQGHNLGPSGSTGYSTGVHLHFEVHRNGVRVNPLNYLP